MPRLRALMADDSPSDVDLALLAFEEAKVDLDIDVVTDGEQALQFLRKQGKYKKAPTPDFLILDLNMPRVCGKQVLKELGLDEELRMLPVVVLSTSEAPDDIDDAYRLGANAYVAKPMDFQDFTEVVKAIDSFWCSAAKLPSRRGH